MVRELLLPLHMKPTAKRFLRFFVTILLPTISNRWAFALIIRVILCCMYNTWQNVNDWVTDFQRGTDFNPVDKDEYVNIATGFDATGNINRILGYQNTKVLWAYNGYCKTNGKTDALVNPAEVLKTFIANNPAPANSTGWFLPSVKELHMLCYKDVDNIAYTRDNTETRDIVEVSISAVGGDALSPRNNHKRFWSSSESPSNKNGAFSVYFYNAFAQLSEKDGALNVRAVCAF